MKKLLAITLLLISSVMLSAEQKKDWGRVSASLESLNHIYADDALNDFYPLSGEDPELAYLNGRYASNNYLKVDYYKGRFSAGVQVEGYFPATVGYPLAQNRMQLSNLYVNWTDDSYSVTAGTFYDQLGSGLLFRSWEDRKLGLNNAIAGARARYSYKDIFSVKVFGGVPRMGKKISSPTSLAGTVETPFFGLGLTDVAVAAGDLTLSLSECFGWKSLALALEGSLLYKHEDLEDNMIARGCKENTLGWSARLNMDADGFYLRGEYVDAGMQVTENPFIPAQRGNAQLVEFGYNRRGLGVSVTGRRLYNMFQRIVMQDFLNYPAGANVLSYRPAMCTQYTYMLTTLVPYEPLDSSYEPLDESYYRPVDDVGGQIDAFYNFRRGTLLGGKRGMRVHANYSSYYTCNADNFDRVVKGRKFLFRDFSVDIEKQFTRKFKAMLLYSLQEYNSRKKGSDGHSLYVGMSHTFVADLLYKWTGTFSTRLELQYLTTKGYEKDWMAGLLEVNFAPHWSVFASDMYNHGGSGRHYYNAGVSFSMKWLHVAAGYGRYRAGYICSGGVCRTIPAYTGANLTLTATF